MGWLWVSCLLSATAPAGQKEQDLSKKETAALLARAQERLAVDLDRFEPYLVQARVQLLMQDGLRPGRFREGRFEWTRWRRELDLPGWHAGEISGQGENWRWSAPGHRDDMEPAADVALLALNPARHLGRAVAKGKGRSVTVSGSPAIEIALSYGVATVDPADAALLSWEHQGSRFDYEGWHRAGPRLWPAGVLVTRDGRDLLRVSLFEPKLGAEALPADLLEPPEGATPIYDERTPSLVPPRLISAPTPTPGPRSGRASGTVILRAHIGTDGRVGRVDLLKGVDPHLDAAAIEAVRRRVYEPGRLHEVPVAIRSTIRITYRAP